MKEKEVITVSYLSDCFLFLVIIIMLGKSFLAQFVEEKS